MKNVKIYSTPTCSFCVRAKQYFTDNNIKFENVDVTMDEKLVEDMVKKSGQMGVPVIDIEGEIIVGFDKEKIDKALGLE